MPKLNNMPLKRNNFKGSKQGVSLSKVVKDIKQGAYKEAIEKLRKEYNDI